MYQDEVYDLILNPIRTNIKWILPVKWHTQITEITTNKKRSEQKGKKLMQSGYLYTLCS